MDERKFKNLFDFFEEGNDPIDHSFYPNITDAKKAINYFNHVFTIEDMYLNLHKFKYLNQRRWTGAGVSIRSPKDKKIIEINKENKKKVATYIYTEFFKELSWLFKIITYVCYRDDLYDYFTKFDFYKRLADRAIIYISKHDERKILTNKDYSRKYIKNLFDEIIDEFEVYIFQLEKELTTVH